MWGIQVEVDGVRVRPVMNAHYSLATLADGTRVTGLPLSYIFALEPECPIYFSGDTAFFDMTAIGRMYRPRVALIGCALPHPLLPLAPGAGEIVSGETDPDEAAEIAEMLGVDVAVGHHYLTLDEQGEQFVQAVRARDSTGARQAFALEPTDVLTIEGDAVRVVQGGHA
jgi:L-ascorbate metabolism protein UlaG (beta-lactamase superfamily)